ncbi:MULTISPECIES: hypothetical protein [Nostocales]|uniref:hypothetical protein n=1 Tax=Nostocales TaxID=1161 RepID=UPI00130EA3B6|nr:MULTISPECIES: hypothetical protein [Nostocales]
MLRPYGQKINGFNDRLSPECFALTDRKSMVSTIGYRPNASPLRTENQWFEP